MQYLYLFSVPQASVSSHFRFVCKVYNAFQAICYRRRNNEECDLNKVNFFYKKVSKTYLQTLFVGIEQATPPM